MFYWMPLIPILPLVRIFPLIIPLMMILNLLSCSPAVTMLPWEWRGRGWASLQHCSYDHYHYLYSLWIYFYCLRKILLMIIPWVLYKWANEEEKGWDLLSGAPNYMSITVSCELFKKPLLCLLIDGAQEYVWLTSASGGSGAVVTKPTFGKLYHITQPIVPTETMLSIFLHSVHFSDYSIIIQNRLSIKDNSSIFRSVKMRRYFFLNAIFFHLLKNE